MTISYTIEPPCLSAKLSTFLNSVSIAPVLSTKVNLPANRRGSNGQSIKPYSGQYFHGEIWRRSLATAPHPPSLWKRYVADTFVIQEEKHRNEFFQHINSLEDKIKFTAESTRADGSMPFLDTLVTPRSDGSLKTKVYRKPTQINICSGTANMP